MRRLKVTELERIFQRILDKLKGEGCDVIEFDNDLYRYIPTDCWDRFDEVPIDSGSLYDDIDELSKLVNEPDRPCTYLDLDRIASILRAISQINNPS